jgi:hypothetical protein
MDSRPGYYGGETQLTEPIRTGSEYVSKLILTNTANVISSALNEAMHMMSAAVNADGSIRDEFSLGEVRKCMDIAITHFEMFRGMQ